MPMILRLMIDEITRFTIFSTVISVLTKFKKPAHTSALIGGTKTAFLFSRVGIGNAACLRLLLEGRGIHAGEGFTALFPDGWHEITLEVAWEPTGPACWYISTPGFKGVCPVGLFVKV